MAEFVHTFRQGKMNQDLDERLIPEGEYRDALNLEVSSSEGSDRGAMQNIIGNLAINIQGYNPSTLVATQWAANEYITALTNATCIGGISDTLNDNVYWLITSDEADVIAKLDQSENVVSPILAQSGFAAGTHIRMTVVGNAVNTDVTSFFVGELVDD